MKKQRKKPEWDVILAFLIISFLVVVTAYQFWINLNA